MNKLLVIMTFLAIEMSFSQTDTMFVDIGSSILKYPISNIIGISFSGLVGIDENQLDKVNNILQDFALHQNYPNPFNPSTTISYSVKRPGMVAINIYDISGSIIKSLIDQFVEVGDYATIWDGKDNFGNTTSSGVYFYQINFNNQLQNKKMIYLK